MDENYLPSREIQLISIPNYFLKCDKRWKTTLTLPRWLFLCDLKNCRKASVFSYTFHQNPKDFAVKNAQSWYFFQKWIQNLTKKWTLRSRRFSPAFLVHFPPKLWRFCYEKTSPKKFFSRRPEFKTRLALMLKSFFGPNLTLLPSKDVAFREDFGPKMA